MMKTYINVTIIFCLLLVSACAKEASPSAPVIKLIDVSSTSIMQFKDSLVISLEYTDENGDIGESDPDKNALMIKDRRLANADFYFVRPLAPPGSNIRINGILKVQVKNVFLLGNGISEITNFDIKLKDKAGNWSNTVSTPEISIHP